MKSLINKLIDLSNGVLFHIVLPPIIVGWMTYGVSCLYDVDSMQFYCWIAFLIWMAINYITSIILKFLKK